jgi:hypothetical protein
MPEIEMPPQWGHRRICSKSYGKRHRGTRSAAFAGAETFCLSDSEGQT